jgi:3-oxoacyl-[acyl-carrier protein] reductase
MEQKTAWVCGASSGIGRAVALRLAQDGMRVVAVGRRQALLQSLSDEINQRHPLGCIPLVLDITNIENLRACAQDILNTYGPVHVLVHNLSGPSAGPLLDASVASLQQAFAQHIGSAHTLAQCLVPSMVASGYGRIINIVSTSVREPIKNLGVSNTVRGAMAAWAKTLALELPAHITINNVLPGYTSTERLDALLAHTASAQHTSVQEVSQQWMSDVPMGRFGDADETAQVVAFLASPQASYVRGVSIAVDGGRTRCI